MSTTKQPRRGRTRVVLAASFAVGVLCLTGAGVYAGLIAQATGTQNVSSGTLSLTVAAGSGSTGFGQTITNVAPGDVNNTYVDLTNGTASNLAAQNLTLGVTGTGSTLLTSSATKGLAVTITQCSAAWTVGTGVCGGTPTVLMVSTPVATLSTTAGSVVSGPIAAGTSWHLQVSLKLPDQAETTLNGVTPTTSIQGLSTVLTYSFDESQRTATTTNS
jgi:spore coat-associated protein N